MALPVNIEKLVHGDTIEWERLEFKKSWNPEDVIHTMCAFANDIHNLGGGYIVIGIVEQDGKPVLPPRGLQHNQLDAIQRKVVELGYKIQPNYFPILQPYVLQEQHIMVLWCPAGDNRIYTAPVSLSAKSSERAPYIRVGSSSIIAKNDNLRRLLELTARVPFDDRINNQAGIHDLDLGLIQAHLQEIKSDLLNESTSMAFTDLCRTMHIVKGSIEDLRPVNVGLMFFCRQPERFFPRCWIELVWHQDNSGKNFKEYYFKGPLHKQLRDTISFIEQHVISEQVTKSAVKAEADRFFNFPFAAVEEVLSNAVYHKSYELGSPIEVQVWPDKIHVLSYPGPVPPVDANILKTHRQIVAREYRNRRIGDFLKELHLTEGRGTGFPTIYDAMESNGSPAPIFESDDNSTYVLVTLPAHFQSIGPGNQAKALLFNSIDEIIAFGNGVGNGVGNGAGNQAGKPANDIVSAIVHDRVGEMLELLVNQMKRSELFGLMGLSNQSKNRAKYLDPLIDMGWVAKEFPDKKTSPNQRYETTKAGRRILQLVGN